MSTYLLVILLLLSILWLAIRLPNPPSDGPAMELRTFTHEGHRYLEKTGAPICPFVHDPNCPCNTLEK